MKVKTIEIKGQSALVEWEQDGMLRRGYVPAEIIEDDHVDETDLDRSIPYGLLFEEVMGDVSASEIIDSLHRAGIWTYSDLTARDRRLIRIGTDLIGAVVWAAAKRLEVSDG